MVANYPDLVKEFLIYTALRLVLLAASFAGSGSAAIVGVRIPDVVRVRQTAQGAPVGGMLLGTAVVLLRLAQDVRQISAARRGVRQGCRGRAGQRRADPGRAVQALHPEGGQLT